MIWHEVKIDKFDFAIQSEYWQIRRINNDVRLYYVDGDSYKAGMSIDKYGSIANAVFAAWCIELQKRRCMK